MPCEDPNERKVDIETLDEFARKQWEGVLGYMVGSTGVNLSRERVQLSEGVTTLLQGGNLIATRGRHVEITQEGFAFLLEDVNAQVWAILMLYLESAEPVSHSIAKRHLHTLIALASNRYP